jgi:hypothetical protein
VLWSVVLVSATLTLVPTTAPPPTPDADRWYGGPAVVTEGASAGLLLLAGGISAAGHNWIAATVLAPGVAGLALGPAINHLVNGYPGRAAGSFGLRVGGLLVGATVAVLIGDAERCLGLGDTPAPPCNNILVGTGFLLPLLGAFVLDDAVLAREPVPPPEKPAQRRVLALSLLGGGALFAAGAGGYLWLTRDNLHNSELGRTPADIEKAKIGIGVGVSLVILGAGALATGAYLLLTDKTQDGHRTAGLSTFAPWTDGRGASGLMLGARF